MTKKEILQKVAINLKNPLVAGAGIGALGGGLLGALKPTKIDEYGVEESRAHNAVKGLLLGGGLGLAGGYAYKKLKKPSTGEKKIVERYSSPEIRKETLHIAPDKNSINSEIKTKHKALLEAYQDNILLAKVKSMRYSPKHKSFGTFFEGMPADIW